MALNIKEVLKELCEISGPSGSEEAVVLRAKKLIEPYVDETWIDALGNLIGLRKCGNPNAKKMLIDAHIDEIGFVVTAIEEGFLKFSALGDFDARLLPASGVKILAEPVLDGVVCVLPPHILRPEDTDVVTKIEDLYIDVGLTQEEAVRLIPIGTAGTLRGRFRAFGENAVCSKALDNRAGFVAMLSALEQTKDAPLDVDLYVMASVKAKTGMRGAETGAFAISPDYCIVVDTIAARTHDATEQEIPMNSGDGVIITRGPTIHRAFTEMLVETAERMSIDHQITVMPSVLSGSNAVKIQVSQGGIVTAFIALPIKYINSANEIASMDDIESATRLLVETIKSVKGGVEQ